ncbi:MAG: branched-chain amino acid ABC transporter permease [Lachnospiraceae bacterium]|nr:branched-chain amino acid ABC transporter permease [Lachnospiraceae bacterium]MCD8382774.1 branched-chain amino acid ABC transporter permease [Clostridiales bacterium]
MYVDAETVIQAAALVTALGVLVGAILSVYKIVERDKRQSVQIKSIQTEQTLLCYSILACLKGLQEQGCDGPVSDAIDRLEKHLNKKAHQAGD